MLDKQIFITFDLDYEEEYAMIPQLVEELGDNPATLFIVGKFIKELPKIGKAQEFGNHTQNHLDWDKVGNEEKLEDLLAMHQRFPFKCYRSPHLRNNEWVDKVMQMIGYPRELPVKLCPHCPQPWSNHHVEQGCLVGLEEGFEELCRDNDYVNVFLDPKRLKPGQLTNLINIAKRYGILKRISDYKRSV